MPIRVPGNVFTTLPCPSLLSQLLSESTLYGTLPDRTACLGDELLLIAFLLLEDEAGLFEAIAFPEVFQHYFSLMVKEGLFIIKGRVGDKNGEAKIIIQKIKNLYSCLEENRL